MILVDTSAWIDLFNRKPGPGKHAARRMPDLDEVVTCPPIVQEVLQGFRDEHAYRVAHEALTAMPCLEAPLGIDVFVEAAQLFRLCRRLGVTLRSSVDCLIATCAIRHEAEVLHVDRDFDALAKVSPLRVRRLG